MIFYGIFICFVCSAVFFSLIPTLKSAAPERNGALSTACFFIDNMIQLPYIFKKHKDYI